MSANRQTQIPRGSIFALISLDEAAVWRVVNMISNDFSDRTLANLEIALERACQRLGTEGMTHECRKFVALKMITAARNGVTTLAKLTEIAQQASSQLSQASKQVGAPGEANVRRKD
jgi:hypothetical protein